MIEIPKFPIRCETKEGEAFTALFKKTGDPSSLKLILKTKTTTTEIFTGLPNTEILSWGGFAIRTFLEHKKANTFSDTLFVQDALPNELYRTAQQTDPRHRYLCRLEGMAGGKYVLQVYFPNLREWKIVHVPKDYKLIHNPKESEMPKKQKPQSFDKKPLPAPKTPTTTNGVGVFEAWGKAFEAHATNPHAPKLIVTFMVKQFPNRKTQWAKWVNNLRARYNAGKLPGVATPSQKIKPYK